MNLQEQIPLAEDGIKTFQFAVNIGNHHQNYL